MIFNFDTTTWHNYFLENKIDVKVDFDSILFIKVINQSGLFFLQSHPQGNVDYDYTKFDI
jgi:hypothetical protein